jgi:MoxR-like ATPase
MPTTFDLLTLVGDVEENWTADRNESELRYRNRKISPNLLEVWFPQGGEEEEGTLQIPLQLYRESSESAGAVAKAETERGNGWARFGDDGLTVTLPGLSVKQIPESDSAVLRQDSQNAFDIETDKDVWMRVWMSYLLYWVICNAYAKNGLLREHGSAPDGFPALKNYKAKRPVDLDPAAVIDRLTDEGLYFPWHVIESACSALNAGKNVIFTGPPGCGKSKLASFLSRQATGREPLMATASPAWTSGDLMGRYMPSREREGLEFREGFFLRAIGQNQRTRWLIIDEFNRADIDACFGELFSVLAGDAVELPFQKGVHEEEIDDAEDLQTVRIIPGGDDAETDADYLVPEEFRLIGTMNDADRSGLNNLSYALMRRFAIIPVEAPDSGTIGKIIRSQIDSITDELQLAKHAWDVSERGNTRCTLDSIENEVTALFASTQTSPDGENSSVDTFQNLVSEAVVGVSVVADLLRFVGEGLRAGIDHDKLRKNAVKGQTSNRKNTKWAENLTLSYLALAVVLQVYPQLEALEVNTGGGKNRLLQAIRHIFASFHQNFDPDELLMLRVSKSDSEYKLESDETISEFLFRNLQTRFPHQAEGWRRELDGYLPDDA